MLPTIALVFEKSIYEQFYYFLTDNKLLNEAEFGFRSLRSASSALSTGTEHCLMNIDNGRMSSTILLDIHKAFGTVNHETLLDQFSCYGFHEQEHHFFSYYLDECKQCCYFSETESTFKQIICSVPQDSILGPLLLILYMKCKLNNVCR